MITVKEMSDFEKFALVQDNIIFYISFVSDFIRQKSWRGSRDGSAKIVGARRAVDP